MASTRDPRELQLKKMATKQMKGILHVKFLQNCRAEDVIPKGLLLKLKLTVGGTSNKLQEKVDSLLHRVSVEVCEMIKEDHMRRSNELTSEMEKLRADLEKDLDNEQLDNLDKEISDSIEKSRTTIEKRHAKKLNFLKENVSNTQPLITEKTQSDDWQIKTSKKKKGAKKTQKNHNEQRPQNNIPKQQTGNTQKNDVVDLTVPASQRETTTDCNSKNVQASSGKKTYAEVAASEATTDNIHTTLKILTQAVTQLIKSQEIKSDKGGLFAQKTKIHGRRQRKDSKK
jgi:hypothetical protein